MRGGGTLGTLLEFITGIWKTNMMQQFFLHKVSMVSTISEPYSVPLKKNPYVPLQEEGENNKVPCSLEVDTSGKGVGNVESKNVSPELTAPSAAKQMRISVDHHVGEAEGNPPLPKFGGDQTGRVAEGKELSQSKDSEPMPPVKVTPSGRDEVVVASNLVDANGNVDRDTNVKLEPPKSSKKKRKSKKSQDPSSSVTENKTGSGIGISSTKPHETIHTDHSSDKSKKEESFMSPVKGKEIPKMTAMNNSVLANDMDSDNVIRNVLESLKDVSKIPMNVENKDEKSRKKTKRKRNSAAKNSPELLEEDENVSFKNVTLSTDGTRDAQVDASLKLMKKTSLVKTSSENKLNGSNLESENNIGIETSPLQDQNGNFPTSGRSNEANNKMEASVTEKRNREREPKGSGGKVQAVDSSSVEPQRSLSMGEGDNPKVHPKTKLARVSGSESKVPVSNKSDKLSKREEATRPNAVNGSANHIRSDKSKQNIAASDPSSVEPQRSLSKGEGDNPKIHPKTKLARVSGSEAKNKSGKLSKKEEATRPNAVNGSATHTCSDKSKQNIAASDTRRVEPQRSLSKGEGDNPKIHPKTKLARVSGSEAKAPVSDKLSKKEEATRPNAVNSSATHTCSDKSKQNIAASDSSLSSSKNILPEGQRGDRHQSRLDVGRCFHYESSDDEDGVYNSDASTRTPSDNSLSSDYSDGDSGAQQNGTSGSKRKESGGRNIHKFIVNFLSIKSLNPIRTSFWVSSGTLEKILRSSSSYKAAKLNASQSQMQNTESQPLEFVPDSQADQQSAPAC
ncbi:hypothetical protein Patl1_16817 [Pistacia atlantica]|uniref:Uncharacterized protein n=1 Tax=Pistacia atlantica TaxID=434234 RepID=A0ACC1B665_9ROSI|nr:hypothetical protein Patl1_16817 [Pistacia atlantica]